MTFLFSDVLWLYALALVPIYIYYKKESDILYKRKIMLLSFVFFLILLALSRPVLSQRVGDVESKGTEIVVAVDLSASMKATDLTPSRSEKATQLLHELVASSTQDKFAILGFTSSAIILSTMTDDKTLLFELFERLNKDHVVSHSTKLHSVFELANNLSLLDRKQLVIFSDGSEGDLQTEVDYAKQHDIAVYCVGMATTSGSSLYDDAGALLTDAAGDIVITSLNENLKTLASRTGGRYFDYDESMSDVIEAIHEDAIMQTGHSKELTYIELFYFPLILSIILFMIATASIFPRYIAVLALFLPLPKAEAGLLDFYYVSQAKFAFEKGSFDKSARAFERLGEKNWQALFNSANAYYKANRFAKARGVYRRIKTTDSELKAKILYNIGNTYAKEYYVKKAVEVYRQSLRLHFDKETLENLLRVTFLEEKTEMFTGRKQSNDRDDTQEQSMSSAGKGQAKASKQQGSSSSSGEGATQSGEKKKKLKTLKKAKVGLSSKQYQSINKGKYNEQNPW